ncbi:MAG: hypothetical protein HY735_01370 [Verrucomicrobia bacterium]|nr:hypothetical protein [Verrucomicrobiota bacterium]
MKSRRRFLRAALTLCGWMLGSFLFVAQAQPNGLERAKAAQNAVTDVLLGIRGVVGTAAGVDAQGEAAVLILVADEGAGRGLPRQLNGVPVSVIVTGEIFALREADAASFAKPAAGATKIDPKKRFARPVPIGVSTGNGNVGSPCSAGTIGARVKDAAGNVYALSNNHVYALENSAPIQSPIHQPGPYDTGCIVSDNNVIASLTAYVTIDFSGGDNTVDAAIAGSNITLVGNATPSNGYGTPKSTVVAAAVGQAVQKYGRTTSLTKGQVVGINATINVGYSSGTARFVDQIVILGTKPFSKAGDSGSLIVTNPERQPVGLLFAGSSNGYTFANRIDSVLTAFGVSVDGE